MTSQLTNEIDSRALEISKLEDRLKALQVTPTAPIADEFDSATEFMQAMREHHASERDRLDELQAVEQVLPSAKNKLKELRDRFDGIKSPVEQHLVTLRAAALEANKIFEQAEQAYQEVFELARHQAALGHQTVFNGSPIDILASPNFPIFAVATHKIAVMGRQQFRDYQNSGNVSAGIET